MRPRADQYSGMTEVPLYDWMKEMKISLLQLSRMLRLAPNTVRPYVHGKACPSLPLAYVFERISNGRVPVDSWLKIPFVMQEIDEALTYIEGPQDQHS